MRRILLLILISLVGFSFAQEVKDTSTINLSKLPTINLSTDEIDNDDGTEVSNISSLLQGSKDAFVNTAGYTFGAARFKMRGYNSEYTEMYMNGIEMNDIEGGRVYWGTWGGLNDMMRNRQYSNGLNLNQFSFGGLGGASYISTRASKYRKSTGASYAIGNRSYRNRLMISYASGMMNNGWAIAASVSKRWAQEGYQEGTSYDAYAYFLSAEKKINKKHSIGITIFGSPSKRGKSGGSVQEAYDLTGNNYYNPNWGYQSEYGIESRNKTLYYKGEPLFDKAGSRKRNARVATSHRPHFMLTHYHKPTDKINVTTSIAYAMGTYSTTALDWYNTRDPRPDYYRNLPSYYDDPTAKAAVTEEFKNNHQLDWDSFYRINQSNENKRSSYIIENRKTDYSRLTGNMLINYKLSNTILIDGGLSYSAYKGRHYKTINDLLGGEYYLDIDKYAERDFPNSPEMIDNDLTNPNKIRKEGDVLGYDYDMNQNKAKGWVQASANFDKIDLFGSVNLSHTTFWRTGYMQNGKFPDHSYGDSEKQKFLNYGAKAGITYKINGRNYVYAQGYYGTKAPYIRNSYISPRTRDFVVDGLQDEKIMSFEGGYHLRSPRVKARITGFYTEFKDQTQVYSFYNDLFHSYTNQILSNIDKQNMGVEIGIEGKINSSFSTTAVAAINQNIYTNRPTGIIIQDNDAVQLAEPTTIYQKNFYQSGPQNAYSLSLKYTNPHYWFVTVSANYFQNNYLSFNPARRTTEAISNESGTVYVEPGSEQWNAIINQEKLADAFTLDVFARKTWRIKGHYFYLNVGVNNILNNTDFVTGGYEQRRFDYKDNPNDSNVDKFPPKYFYAYGINYFISLGFWL